MYNHIIITLPTVPHSFTAALPQGALWCVASHGDIAICLNISMQVLISFSPVAQVCGYLM